METLDKSLTEAQASEFLGIAQATLRKMRSLGPMDSGLPAIPFYKYSSRCVRYSLRDLENWKAAFRVDESAA